MDVRKPSKLARRNTVWSVFPAARATWKGHAGPNEDFRHPDEEEGLDVNLTSAWSSVMATDGGSSIRSEAVPGESFQRAYVGELGQGSKLSGLIVELRFEIEAVETKIARVEKAIADTQVAAQCGSPYSGKQGDLLQAEEARLVRKEEQLREEKKQLQEEKLLLLNATVSKTRGTSGIGSKRFSNVARLATYIVESGGTGDSANEAAGGADGFVGPAGAQRHREETGLASDGNTAVAFETIPTVEDDRLITRLDSFSNPILVSTLIAGFCLGLFELSELRLVRQFVLFSFALEISASLVLCGIAFHAQQLYCYSSFEDPKTRTFLQEIRPFTMTALAFSTIGIALFTVAFILEASELVGHTWLALVSVVLFPSAFAGTAFIGTIRVMKRLSMLSKRRARESE